MASTVHCGGVVVVALKRGDTFWLEGDADMFIAAGRVELFGALLNAGAMHSVYATEHALAVECTSTKTRALKRKSVSGDGAAREDEVAARVAELTKGAARGTCAVIVLRPPSGRRPTTSAAAAFTVSTAAAAAMADGSDAAAQAASPRRAINVPAAWRTVAAQLCADSRDAGGGAARRRRRPTRVLICGPKGVGKSTFGRYLLNRLLSTQITGKGVAYLETDLGQSEFTPAGHVALHRVTRPVLGPPHTHVRPARAAYFVGVATPEQVPETYVKCVRAAFADFAADLAGAQRERAPQRLLVNTHGWVKGAGREMLEQIIALVRPTHIVKIEGMTRTKMFELTLPARSAPGASGVFPPEVLEMTSWTTTFPRAAVSAAQRRAQQLEAYFLPRGVLSGGGGGVGGGSSGGGGGSGGGGNIGGGSSAPRAARTPAQRLATQRPYAVPWDAVVVRTMHERVQPSQVLYALNGAVVGLARISEAISQAARDASADAGGAAVAMLRETPIVQCAGLGIVRAIDPERRLLYILTPLAPAELAGVNALLLGSIALPKLLTVDATLRPALYATPWSVAVSGTEVFRARRF